MKPRKPKPIANLKKSMGPPARPGGIKPLPGAKSLTNSGPKSLPGAKTPSPSVGPGHDNTPQAKPPAPPSGRYQSLIFDADRFFQDKDFKTAFGIYKKACAEAPPGENHCYAQVCRCYRKLALKALKKDQFQKVIDLLEDMMELNGDRPNLKAKDFQVLGECYYELDQLEDAKECFEEALDMKPELFQEIKGKMNQIKASELNQEFKNLY